MRGTSVLFALALCVCPTLAHAENDVGAHVSSAFRRCMASAATNNDQSHCLDGELQRQKAALNTAYAERVRTAHPAFSSRLERAQRMWIAFREADCEAQTLHGGSGASAWWLTCMVRLTADRAVELETYGAF